MAKDPFSEEEYKKITKEIGEIRGQGPIYGVSRARRLGELQAKKKALIAEQGRRKKEHERRAELSKTRNLLGLRGESALTTPQVDPGLLKRPEDIEAKPVGGGTQVQAVRTPQPASALTSPVDTSAADARAREVTQTVDTKSIMGKKKKRSEAVSALGSQTAERKRLLTSALG